MKLKKNASCIKIQSITVTKAIVKFNARKRIEAEKMVRKIENRCANQSTMHYTVKQWKK